MPKPSKFAITLANRLDESLLALSGLAKILVDNSACKADQSTPEQQWLIDPIAEQRVQSAIKVIADMSRRDMHELASELDIPHE